MSALSAQRVEVRDATRTPGALRAARRSTDLERGLRKLGFRHLGVARTIARDGHGTEDAVSVVLLAPASDAWAVPERIDGQDWLLFRTVLASGVVVETRMVPVDVPPASRLVAWADARTGAPSQSLLTRVVGATPAPDAPDRPGCGLRQRTVTARSPQDLWQAHCGFVMTCAGDAVTIPTHRTMALFLATCRRVWHVQTVHEALIARLLEPAGLAVIAVGLLAMGAIGHLAGLPTPSLALLLTAALAGAWFIARWLVGALSGVWVALLVPVLVAVQTQTGLALAQVVLTTLAVLGLYVVRDLVLVAIPVRLGGWLRGRVRSPAPVPMPELLQHYGDPG